MAIVGAGATSLVGKLLGDHHRVIAVDIAGSALDRLHAEHPDDAALALRNADVRTVQLDEPVDVWHDRAVFHFFVSADDQRDYASNVSASVRAGGHLVLATFGIDGPAQCSGLPVQRHDAASISAIFVSEFELVEAFPHDHLTPWGAPQRFLYTVLRRR